MAEEELHVSFEGPKVGETGVPIDDLQKTLAQLQKAFSLMVSHLEEEMTPSGRAPAWVRKVSSLRLLRTSPGSLVAELGVPRIRDDRDALEDSSLIAIDRILNWCQEEDHSLPEGVANELLQIGSVLSPDISQVRLRNSVGGNGLVIRRNHPSSRGALGARVAPVKALLYGWLKAVNWDKRTAELHRYGEHHVTLRFDVRLHDTMLLNATNFVEVIGQGKINRNDRWQYFQVERISNSSQGGEPFDLETFLNDPNPKLFNSANVVSASEPFDVEEFIRVIREGRDVGREDALQ